MALKKKQNKTSSIESIYKIPKILGVSFDYFSVYLGFFIMVALIVLLGVSSSNFSAYSALINYIAIFEITVSIGIFTYIGAALKKSTLENNYYSKYLTLYAEIMFVSTIVFVLCLFLLPAKSTLATSPDVLIVSLGEWVTTIASFFLIFSVLFFISAMIETIFVLVWKIFRKTLFNWKNNLGKIVLPKCTIKNLSISSEMLLLLLSITTVFFSVGLANYWLYNEDYKTFINLNDEGKIYSEFNNKFMQFTGSELLSFDEAPNYSVNLSCNQGNIVRFSFNDGNNIDYSGNYLCNTIGLKEEAFSNYFTFNSIKRLFYLNYMKMEFLNPQIEKSFKDKWHVLTHSASVVYSPEFDDTYRQMIRDYYEADSLVSFNNTSEYVQLIKEMAVKRAKVQSAFNLLLSSGIVLLFLILAYAWCVENKNNLLYKNN